MLYLVVWWLVLFLIGLAGLPVAFRFFPGLPDRGYAFVKPLGLLLVVYPFWLLTSFGFLENTYGVTVVTFLVVILAAWGILLWGRDFDALRNWLRENLRYLLVVEAVFLVAFFTFAYFRSFNPEITATEKPMEFMFLNSILRSVQFPPHDSWLSGYAISYYYLGYTIVAFLTRLTAIPSNFTFNLGLTMVYASSATGAFGLGYNLVKTGADRSPQQQDGEGHPHSNRTAYLTGVLAILLLLIVGNLEAPFESLHNAGVGSDAFYNALDVNGLAQAPKSGSLIPEDNWWWWRASRVVNDHNPTTGEHIEVIDEFPAFSFLLGDLHPHVLALPFDLLALAVALNLLRSSHRGSGGLNERVMSLLTPGMLLTGVIIGSLGMLNTWDLVTYGLIVIAARTITRVRETGAWRRAVLLEGVIFGIVLFAASYLLYLPFYIGFSSQVQGVMVSVFFKTPLHQYLMMFGIFVFALTSFVGTLVWQRRHSLGQFLHEASNWALLVLAFPLAVAAIALLVLARSPELRSQAAAFLGTPDSANVMIEAARAYFEKLVTTPFVFVLLLILISSTVALARLEIADEALGRQVNAPLHAGKIFALLLGLVGFTLTLGVEFLYVLDVFGSRMNTVFKLYFQAWTLFSVAAAFGISYVFQQLGEAARNNSIVPAGARPNPVWRVAGNFTRPIWIGALVVLLALSLVYPLLAYLNRANNFQANTAAGIPTLDGTAWIKSSNVDDYAAIQWVNSNVPTGSTILEAPGPQYSFYDRVSVATGLQTVLGWGGHEVQWRGNGDLGAKREQDVAKIYQAQDANQARVLLQQYGVDFVIVGGLEREKYGLTSSMVDKFGKLGQLVFNQGSIKIFMVDP